MKPAVIIVDSTIVDSYVRYWDLSDAVDDLIATARLALGNRRHRRANDARRRAPTKRRFTEDLVQQRARWRT